MSILVTIDHLNTERINTLNSSFKTTRAKLDAIELWHGRLACKRRSSASSSLPGHCAEGLQFAREPCSRSSSMTSTSRGSKISTRQIPARPPIGPGMQYAQTRGAVANRARAKAADQEAEGIVAAHTPRCTALSLHNLAHYMAHCAARGQRRCHRNVRNLQVV